MSMFEDGVAAVGVGGEMSVSAELVDEDFGEIIGVGEMALEGGDGEGVSRLDKGEGLVVVGFGFFGVEEFLLHGAAFVFGLGELEVAGVALVGRWDIFVFIDITISDMPIATAIRYKIVVEEEADEFKPGGKGLAFGKGFVIAEGF